MTLGKQHCSPGALRISTISLCTHWPANEVVECSIKKCKISFKKRARTFHGPKYNESPLCCPFCWNSTPRKSKEKKTLCCPLNKFSGGAFSCQKFQLSLALSYETAYILLNFPLAFDWLCRWHSALNYAEQDDSHTGKRVPNVFYTIWSLCFARKRLPFFRARRLPLEQRQKKTRQCFIAKMRAH